MPIQQITPQQAKEILDRDIKAIYVDVRSVSEFVAGHAGKAINIPVLHYNQQTGQMTPNPDFQKVASAVLPKDRPLVVGCKTGGRSQKACEILAGLGYEKLHNIMGGFGGGQNTLTGGPQKGWKDSGLPVSQENGEGVSYESLSQKANS